MIACGHDSLRVLERWEARTAVVVLRHASLAGFHGLLYVVDACFVPHARSHAATESV